MSNLINDQFPILIRGARIAVCGAMLEKVALSDQLEERLIEFAAAATATLRRTNRHTYGPRKNERAPKLGNSLCPEIGRSSETMLARSDYSGTQHWAKTALAQCG